MKILITGGVGFIGSHFVCSALERGHTIVNIDNLSYAANLRNLEGYNSHRNYIFHQEDICHYDAIEKIVFETKPDIILHMAAESHVDRSIDCADIFIRTNINGTYTLLNVARKYYNTIENKECFRFMHLSTDEVFGALGLEGKFSEEMPYKPNSPYAASKASSDLLARAYFRTYGLPVIVINASNNYGPKQYPEKLIPLSILNALEYKSLPVYGDGKQIRDWLYVQDHIEALFALISHGVIGESYCVGADNEITNLALISNICTMLDELKPFNKKHSDLITFVKDRPGHDFRYATDASKIRKHTGWSPKVEFEDGLRRTVQWYIDQFDTMSMNSHARARIGLLK